MAQYWQLADMPPGAVVAGWCRGVAGPAEARADSSIIGALGRSERYSLASFKEDKKMT